MTLSILGWDDGFAASFRSWHAVGLVPARVALEHKHAYDLLGAAGEMTAGCTGRLLHAASTRANLPAVGDWVAIRPRHAPPHDGVPSADIHGVVPRRTKFSRRAAGGLAEEQIVAANVDTVFLVSALDHTFNLRRLERYLAVAWESGAQPVVVLNKADLHPDPAAARQLAESAAANAPVVVLSAARGDRLDVLHPWLVPGRTIALLGSSGVGKSTLINRILGHERQATGAISDAVGKGRHTTTHRELIVAPTGVLVIDTPGMRELQLWDLDAAALDSTFGDIAQLAAACHFRDCSHRAEPGCAVQAALEAGTLEASRWQSYQKLQREQAYAARRGDARLDRDHRSHWKKINRDLRARHRAEERE